MQTHSFISCQHPCSPCMARYTSRTRRTCAVINSYTKFVRKRHARHQVASRHIVQVQPVASSDSGSLLSTSVSSFSTSFESYTDSGSESDSSSSPDSSWGSSDDSALPHVRAAISGILADLPDLIPVDYLDEPGDLDSYNARMDVFEELMDLDGGGHGVELDWEGASSDLGDEWSSGEDADDEESELESDEDMGRSYQARTKPIHSSSRVGRHVRRTLAHMYSTRYEAARNTLPRGPGYLPHVLHSNKHSRPDKFREQLRVSPYTFDRVVARLASDLVFHNESDYAQMPVEEQVAITLYRFGHYGNGASLQEIANWAGCGKGTVDLVTRRVMTALLRPDFLEENIRYPTQEEKENAKVWVEAHSCKAWRDGWCMVDGTLVPLDERPFWYGESYYDRKGNYSLNIQVSSLVFSLVLVS